MKGRIIPIAACFTVLLLSAALAACGHEHTYAEEWTTDATHHWHEATCEHTGEKDGYAEHTWDGGTVTTAATCTEAGEKTYTCTVCSATKTEVIAATGHSYADTTGTPLRVNIPKRKRITPSTPTKTATAFYAAIRM